MQTRLPAARTVKREAHRFLELRSAIGTLASIEYATKQRLLRTLDRLGLPVRGHRVSLHLRGRSSPIYARYGSSDLDVFEQVFVAREHSQLGDIRNVRLVVDAGAYVGYSSIYLLEAFPDAHVIAIEPDEANFSLLERNLWHYRDRITLLRSAIWSHKTRLVVSRGVYRDGREWATQVRQPVADEVAGVDALDIGTLLNERSLPRIDILKMDIEGAEAVVFSREKLQWLDRVGNIAIELHDKECETLFFRSLAGYTYDLSRSGELTICKNIVRDGRAA